MKTKLALLFLSICFVASTAQGAGQERNLYWGDTHLHTYFSPDAFLMQNRSASPDTAYRWAKGEPVVHPYTKAKIQIGTPLDFLVVSDHGEYMGVVPGIYKGNPLVANTALGKKFKKLMDEGKEMEAFNILIGQVNAGKADPELNSDQVRRAAWTFIMDSAERHNNPGKFTTFLGWEWSSTPGGANLHRVVFLKEGKKVGSKFLPYTSFDSVKPEDLWAWLEKTSQETNSNILAIPHNSNISKGKMYSLEDSEGRPISVEYARTRMKWEPILEMTQIKGDSETHPKLSPTDEFADYETYEHVIEVGSNVQVPPPDKGDYARSALKRGLKLEEKLGVNPYKFGMIGSTDSHTSMASAEENNFWGKVAIDSIPENKTKEILPGATGNDMSAAGLVAVWSEENTRGSIFDAFRRKEVYGTTGPRIRVRFFGGWDYQQADIGAPNLTVIGYQKGVPMGGDLTKAPAGKAPTFLITAAKDPKDANLDRIQVIKGWLDAKGQAQEKVYDVAWSGQRKKSGGKVGAVGNTVNLKTAKYTNTIGSPNLAGLWADPDFDPSQRAFYYVRVLQIPTPRNSLYDAVAMNAPPPKGHATTIQERAYTSPIWYTP